MSSPGKGGLGSSCSTAGKLGKVSPAGHDPLWEEDEGTNPREGGKRSSMKYGKRENTFYDKRGQDGGERGTER